MKARRIALFSLLLFSALSYGFISADDDPIKAFLSKLERYTNNYSTEKVHIHTDKPYYSIGDTIWLKAYVVNATKNQLSDWSKILYVELINEKDSIKKSLRLPVISGQAWGDFTLADSLVEGNYRIRAYTNWMRNFDEAYFFDKTIKIGNSLSSEVISNVTYDFSKTGIKENVTASITYTDLDGKPFSEKEVEYTIELDNRNILKGNGTTDSKGNLQVRFTNAQPFILKAGKINTLLKIDTRKQVRKVFSIKATSTEVGVQFFPESGTLVGNLRSRVAFKAIGTDGLGKNITGYIRDDKANKVAEFKSEYAGMGSFLLTPLKGNVYTAVVKFEDGSEKNFDLPEPVETGYVLAINNSDSENLSVKITTTVNQDANDELILVAQSNGIVHFLSKNKLDKTVLAAAIPKKRFSSGIVQFTLFNASYQPLAERLVFIRHQSPLKVDIKTEKETYSAREKVKMTLNAVDSAGKSAQGTFSIAITDESRVPFYDVNETTILSNFLLTSELKGYIETPNYYFENINSGKEKELDNLILTQGWRKFDWKQITAGIYPALTFGPEKSISISGRVFTLNGKPAAGGKVSLLSAGGTGMALDTIADALGKFRFENLFFNDSTRFIVQARSAKDKKNVEIQLDMILPQIVTKNINAATVEVNVNQSLLPYLKVRSSQFAEMRKNGQLRRSIVLSEVRVTESKKKVKNSSNLNGAGNADAVLGASDLENCSNLAICLQGRVAGLIIQNGVAYLTRSMYSSFSGAVPMQLIVDGMYMEPSYLSTIFPGDVESIEVLKGIGNTAIYGMRGGGGVLIITTKRGERNLSASSFARGIASYTPQGYYLGRKFYSPDYEVSNEGLLPDLRTTIFWAPNIITDKDGKAALEFFTADKPAIYKAVVEGLDLSGDLMRQVYRFNVK